VGSLYVGSRDTVVRKIAATLRDLGASRFDLMYSAGTLPHDLMLGTIELYGREMIPRVCELLAEPASTSALVNRAASSS
jgi:hypothetical protein